MDRTVATGTGYTAQYSPEVGKIYESLKSTPDELLLFFHHVAYTHRLSSGKTVIQHIYDSHYDGAERSEEHTSELQSLRHLVCRLLLEKKKKTHYTQHRHKKAR